MGYEHTVNAHINRLRGKIDANPAEPEYVLTVWGAGYKFHDRHWRDRGERAGSGFRRPVARMEVSPKRERQTAGVIFFLCGCEGFGTSCSYSPSDRSTVFTQGGRERLEE
jgi:hypothetical protein